MLNIANNGPLMADNGFYSEVFVRFNQIIQTEIGDESNQITFASHNYDFVKSHSDLEIWQSTVKTASSSNLIA